MKLDTLKSRIGNSAYEVDADAVAEAIVRRLLAARLEIPASLRELETPGGGALKAG